MPFNLLESVKGLLTPDLVSGAASYLGESNAGISRAIDGAIPVLLNGVLAKAGTDGSAVLTLAQTAASSGILDNMGSLFGNENSKILSQGTTLLSGLFGNKASAVSSLLSGFAGIRPSSSGALLSALAPLALGVIGRHAISNNLDARSLGSFLSGQKDIITKAIPSGLSISGLFEETPKIQAAYSEPERSSGLPGWLLPLLLFLAGGLLLFYFLRGCGSNKTHSAAIGTTAVMTSTAARVTLGRRVSI